jgi:hypothetical protein
MYNTLEMSFEKKMVSFHITIHSKRICQQTHKNYSVNKLARMKQVEIAKLKTEIHKWKKTQLKTLPFIDTYDLFGLG